MIKINFKKIKNEKGFTLLFAILVSIMVLAVGTSIINISLKQVILSSSGRESQYAFYAANSGLECALYWDYNGAIVNDDGTASYVFPPPGSETREDLSRVKCSGRAINYGDNDTNNFTRNWVQVGGLTTFQIEISNTTFENVLYCAEVTVEKSFDPVATSSIITRITSQGLNTCEPESDTRAVQRGLVLEYRS